MSSAPPRRTLAVLALLSLATTSVNAALMVDWGGNYVSGNQAYSNATLDGANTLQNGGFVDGNPLILSPSSNYSGTSATFYGEIIRTGGTGTGSLGTVSNSASADRLEVKQNSGSVSALFLWKKSDFLNGLNTEILNLGFGSTVSTTIATYAAGVPGRAVVKSSGNYYISSAIFSATGTSTVDLTTLSWFSYTPSMDISSIGAAYSLVGNGAITNVTEIGFFTGVTATDPNAVRISSIEFNYVAALIPEPSSFAALAGVLALGTCALRRKRA